MFSDVEQQHTLVLVTHIVHYNITCCRGDVRTIGVWRKSSSYHCYVVIPNTSNFLINWKELN